jgi:hypothetical protein
MGRLVQAELESKVIGEPMEPEKPLIRLGRMNAKELDVHTKKPERFLGRPGFGLFAFTL